MKKQDAKRLTQDSTDEARSSRAYSSPPGSPARWVAFHALNAILRHEEDDAMQVVGKVATACQLSDADRRLAAAIVLSVLRHLTTIDYQIQQYLPTKRRPIEPMAHLLLRMVTAQRHYLDKVPSYAAVCEAVEIAKALSLKSATVAFVNAVGRRLVAQSDLKFPTKASKIAELAVKWSQPEWLVKRFLDVFGQEPTEQLLAKLNEEPRHAVRVNVLRISPPTLTAQWAEAGIAVEPSGVIPEALLLKSSADLARALEHSSFASGFFYVQDEASQIVSHFVAPQAGERILDLCAAPGGKTTHLAELSRGQAQIDATDRDPERLKRVEENIFRLGSPNVRIVPFEDVLSAAQSGKRPYDAVLVDAPCSAVGTIRRHPEVRWRVTPKSIEKLVRQQRELLSLAAALVRVGGRIVYATCSPLPEENEAILGWFLDTHPEYSVSARIPSLPVEIERQREMYCTWPLHPYMDGFSIGVLQCGKA